jgi:hypothetical protein
MSNHLQSLSDQIFEIKDKCTDKEYKELMDTLGKVYSSKVVKEPEPEPVEEEEEIDRLIRQQLLEEFDRPLRGTKEWIELPVSEKAKWCKMSVEHFIKQENEKPYWMEVEYYKKYPNMKPSYLKEHALAL